MSGSCTLTGRVFNGFLFVTIIAVAFCPVAPASTITVDKKSTVEVDVLQGQNNAASESSQAPETQDDPDSQVDDSASANTSMSTGTKVAIGVGAGVVAIGGIAALSGGSSADSTPVPPTEEQIAGVWQAHANSIDDRTYSGTYTLYAGGSLAYDLYISDGRHKIDNGTWTLNAYNLTLRNNNGSTYNGDFVQGVTNSVTLLNTAGTWKLVITR